MSRLPGGEFGEIGRSGERFLASIDDPNDSDLGRWLAERTGLPLVPDVGYPTTGSFGTWGAEQGLPVVTYEFGLTNPDAAAREHVPVLVELLTVPR